jgi:recombination protein RecR
MSYPKPFKKLIENFAALPSIGPKMAERLVLYLFKQSKNMTRDFSENLLAIQNLKTCRRCYNIAEGELCEICKDLNRDQKTICVVEEPLDIIPFERTGQYRGLYHVLGGVVFLGKDKDLKIPELEHRIKKEGTEEIILATNPTTEGDATALYLKKKLSHFGIKLTRLARGLATGGDIEYADEITLSSALTNRREMK